MADSKDFSTISTQELASVSAKAAVGSDGDLPANQRRNRAAPLVDKDGTVLVSGDTVMTSAVPGGVVTVIGHGRGIGWVLCAYKQKNALYIGTYPVGSLTKK